MAMIAVSASASTCVNASLIALPPTPLLGFCDNATQQPESLFQQRETDLSEIGVESESKASVGPIKVTLSVDVFDVAISIDRIPEALRSIPRRLVFQLLKPPRF